MENIMASTNSIMELNRDLANKLLEEAKQNPSAFAGKFVGIANGQVVVVTNDLDEMGSRLRQAEPDPARRYFIELGRDYSEVHEIWEVT
jgi:hypothetical protein